MRHYIQVIWCDVMWFQVQKALVCDVMHYYLHVMWYYLYTAMERDEFRLSECGVNSFIYCYLKWCDFVNVMWSILITMGCDVTILCCDFIDKQLLDVKLSFDCEVFFELISSCNETNWKWCRLKQFELYDKECVVMIWHSIN